MAQRDRILTFFVTGSAIIIGLLTKDKENWPLLGVIPILANFAAAMYAQTDLNIRMLSIWLKTDYSSLLEAYRQEIDFNHKIVHWDKSVVETDKKTRGFASCVSYITTFFIFFYFHC